MILVLAFLFTTIGIIGIVKGKELKKGRLLTLISSVLLLVFQILCIAGSFFRIFLGGFEILTVSVLLIVLLSIPFFMNSKSVTA
jgi:hypothetical protein